MADVSLREQLEQHLNKSTVRAVVSGRRKSQIPSKWVFRPFMKKEQLMFQQEEYRNNQIFHKNMRRDEAVERILSLLESGYKQLDLQCEQKSIRVLVSKKGKCAIQEHRQQAVKKIDLAHNRKKKYILDGSDTVPFLVDLGVQTKEGKIVDKKRKKLGQINRFLEFIRDVLPELSKYQVEKRPLRILDFGCGKSYLTFAVYHYLKIQNGFDVEMTGLDLKEDVIRHCSDLAEAYGYEGLRFCHGDISDYEETGQVDLVITLHACDTATDFALAQAVRWGAKVILSVPCCQHEINGQISSDVLRPLLKYGLIKERMAALITDAVRAELLEKYGYDTQILEFIDMEHTPKNLLIRAVKKSGGNTAKSRREKEQYDQLCDALCSHGTLERLLK